MIVLHTLVFDKDYTKLTDPLESLLPISEYGLSERFYGGNVTKIGKLKDSKIFLLIDDSVNGLKVKDIAVDNLEDFDFKVLKDLAKQKNIKFKPIGTSKEILIDEIKKVALTLEQRLSVA